MNLLKVPPSVRQVNTGEKFEVSDFTVTVSGQKHNKKKKKIRKRHLFFDDSNRGVSDVQQDGGPVLFPCGGHQTVYRSIYHVHS